MTDTEQISERLTQLERSVTTLTEMVKTLLSQTGQAEHAAHDPRAEYVAPSALSEHQKPIIETDHPLIIKIEGVRGGAPITRHAHISVHAIIGWIRIGETPEQIRQDYEPHLSMDEICDALSYYLHHPAEIDEILARHEAAHARAPELSRLAAERKKAEAR